MTHSIKFTAAALTAALIGAGTTHALADTQIAGVTQFQPSPLTVLSNGQEYTKLDVLGMTNIGVHLEYDTGNVGRVKSWTASPIIVNGYGIAAQIPGLTIFKISKSYPSGSRPKVVDRHEIINVPATSLANAAVGMCNMRAANLRDQGKSDQYIFGSDREVSFKVDVDFDVDATLAGSNNPIIEATAQKTVKVICKKWTGARIPTVGGLKAPLEIKKATMKLQEVATMGGACMVKLTTAINTTEAGATLKFRYVHSSGKKSKIFTAKTAGNNIAVVKHEWQIPNKAGPETGWMQLEGVSPNFHSNKATYNMNCKSGGQVGGFQPKPGKPKVAVPLGSNRLRAN